MADQVLGAPKVVADEDIEIVHDIQDTPSFYIDGAQGFSLVHGVVKINCYQVVQQFGASEKESTIKKHFNLQLVMSPTVGKSLASWLMQQLTAAEKDEATTPVKNAE